MDSQQPLLAAFKNPDKLASIRRKLQSSTGGIYQGTIPDPEWGRKHLGETYDKVILASAGVEKAFTNPDEYTVLGGWCALRTKDLQNIQRGFLINPFTGSPTTIKTVKQVSQWIKEAISLDQIVETVGLYNGNNYVLISEVSLWAKKIIRYLEQYFSRNLTPYETDSIFTALEESETIRCKITKRYIEYAKEDGINITRVTDTEIYHELVEQRNELLSRMGTSLREVAEEIVNNRKPFTSSEIHNLTNFENYIDEYSLVLTMYTGPYLELLQNKKYVTTPSALIIEPWTHIRANNEAMAFCNQKIFANKSGRNNYLTPSGINANLAFIAVIEASNSYFIPDKVVKNISEVPNLKNYNRYLKQERQEISKMDQPFLDNDIFSFTYNYYPYGICNSLLCEALSKTENHRIRSNQQTSSTFSAVKERINEELQQMLDFIFGL